MDKILKLTATNQSTVKTRSRTRRLVQFTRLDSSPIYIFHPPPPPHNRTKSIAFPISSLITIPATLQQSCTPPAQPSIRNSPTPPRLSRLNSTRRRGSRSAPPASNITPTTRPSRDLLFPPSLRPPGPQASVIAFPTSPTVSFSLHATPFPAVSSARLATRRYISCLALNCLIIVLARCVHQVA